MTRKTNKGEATASLRESEANSDLKSLSYTAASAEKAEHFIDTNIICKEFAPDVFAQLRAKDGYKQEDFLGSLDPELPDNIR